MYATNAQSTEINSVIASPGPRFRLGSGLRRAWREWRARDRLRAELGRMGDRDFHDFGTTRQQLEFELESPVVRLLRRFS